MVFGLSPIMISRVESPYKAKDDPGALNLNKPGTREKLSYRGLNHDYQYHSSGLKYYTGLWSTILSHTLILFIKGTIMI